MLVGRVRVRMLTTLPARARVANILQTPSEPDGTLPTNGKSPPKTYHPEASGVTARSQRVNDLNGIRTNTSQLSQNISQTSQAISRSDRTHEPPRGEQHVALKRTRTYRAVGALLALPPGVGPQLEHSLGTER